MGLENNYLEYVAEFSLVMFALSSAYFFNPSNLVSIATLLPITILFGYTSFISDNGFHFSSLLSLFAIPFLLVEKLAIITVVIVVGNILISIFANGKSFKDYYGAVSLPMLALGILLGVGLFFGASTQPGIQNQIESSATDLISEQTSTIIDESGIIEAQKTAGKSMVKSTSTATLTLTQSYIRNRSGSLSPEANRTITEAFSDARNEVPERLIERSNSSVKTDQVVDDVSSNMGSFLTDNLVILIPVIALGFYSLHPIVGILTALSALVFRLLAGKFSSPES